MDLERIERALRVGPLGEPVYVPGSFRSAVRRGWSLAMVSAAVGSALVLGLVIGIGLQAFRERGLTGARPDLVALRAELQGRWVSDVIGRQQWIDALLSRGHQANDLDAYLVHDPMAVDVQYVLPFRRNELTITSITDGGAEVVLTVGDYALLADGRITWQDVGGTGISEPCVMTADLDLDDSRLAFGAVRGTGCTADEAIALSAFFELSSYRRAE